MRFPFPVSRALVEPFRDACGRNFCVCARGPRESRPGRGLQEHDVREAQGHGADRRAGGYLCAQGIPGQHDSEVVDY